MRKKQILAFVLVLALTAIVMPLAAFAGEYLVISGYIDEVDDNYILVRVGGADHPYFIDENTTSNVPYLEEGDRVRVFLSPENPDTAVAVEVVRPANPPAQAAASHYSVTGTVTDAGMSSITVLNRGTYRTFDKEDADVLNAPDGILLGDTVKIIYEPDSPDIAIQVILVAHGGNHENHSHSTHSVTHYGVTGPIVDATTNTITIYTKGKYRTFGREDAQLVGVRDGIALGDTVRIVYAGDNPKEAIQIKMVKQGDNH